MISKIYIYKNKTQQPANNALILLSLCFILVSCEKKEEIPPSPIPYISYKSISQGSAINLIGVLDDTLVVSINYQDGDSDLGLTFEEIGKPPYGQYNSDGTLNKYFYNYWIDIYQKKNGSYELVNYDWPLSGIFPKIRPEGGLKFGGNGNLFVVYTHSPYRGEIQYTLKFPRQSNEFYKDTIKCSITIVDRAFQESNTIETPEFVFGQ